MDEKQARQVAISMDTVWKAASVAVFGLVAWCLISVVELGNRLARVEERSAVHGASYDRLLIEIQGVRDKLDALALKVERNRTEGR